MEIPTNQTGIYTINVRQLDGDEIVSSTNTAAIMQYSMEYRFYPDNTLLDEYVASVGGAFIEEASQVFATQPEHVKSRWNLATPLLVVAAFFFLMDIALRRFHIDWTKVFVFEGKKKVREQEPEQEKPKKKKEKRQEESGTAEQVSYVSQLSGMKKEVVMPQPKTQMPKQPKPANVQSFEKKAEAPAGKPVQQVPRAAKPAPSAPAQGKPAAQVKVWKRNETPAKPPANEAKPANNRLDTQALLKGLKDRE